MHQSKYFLANPVKVYKLDCFCPVFRVGQRKDDNLIRRSCDSAEPNHLVDRKTLADTDAFHHKARVHKTWVCSVRKEVHAKLEPVRQPKPAAVQRDERRRRERVLRPKRSVR